VFQTDLFDWYLRNGHTDRLLLIQSPYVATYLERRFEDDIIIADLLWKHHRQSGNTIKAAQVQLQLARSAFPISLNERLELLGRARANASASSFGTGRQMRQALLNEISAELDVGGIQGDILEKIRDDTRFPSDRREDIVNRLNGAILGVDTVGHFTGSFSI
jgi:nuclear pore complex protein Nup155